MSRSYSQLNLADRRRLSLGATVWLIWRYAVEFKRHQNAQASFEDAYFVEEDVLSAGP